MEEKSQTTEAKIIQAGIECIDRYGIEGVTSRRIAESAGVNGAAINYYFRSKEVLIQKCLEQTLENAFDWNQYKDMTDRSARELLTVIFRDILGGALQYPGIARFHLVGVIESKGENLTVSRMGEFLLTLENAIKERQAPVDEKKLRHALADAFFALLMATVAPSAFHNSLGVDLREEPDREQFIQRLIDLLLS